MTNTRRFTQFVLGRATIGLGMLLAIGCSSGSSSGGGGGGGGGGGNKPAKPTITAPLTNDAVGTPLQVDGSGEAGASITATLKNGTNTLGSDTATADATGAFNLLISYTEPTKDTALTLSVTQTVSGETSDSTEVALVQGGAPDAPIVTAPVANADIASPVLVTGTSEAGATVTAIVYEGLNNLGGDSVVAGAGGAFSISADFTAVAVGTDLQVSVQADNSFGASASTTVDVVYQPRFLDGTLGQNSGNTAGTKAYVRLYDDATSVLDYLQQIEITVTDGQVFTGEAFSFEIPDGTYYLRAYRDSGQAGGGGPDGHPTLWEDAQTPAVGPFVISGSDSTGNALTLNDSTTAGRYREFNVFAYHHSAFPEPPEYYDVGLDDWIEGDGFCRGYYMRIEARLDGSGANLSVPMVRLPALTDTELLNDGGCNDNVADNTAMSYDNDAFDDSFSYGIPEPGFNELGDYVLFFRDTNSDFIHSTVDNIAAVNKLSRIIPVTSPSGADVGNTTDAIQWDPLGGAAAYYVQVSNWDVGYWESSGIITTTTFTPNVAMPNDNYVVVRIEAYDANPNVGEDVDAMVESAESAFVVDDEGDSTITVSGTITNDSSGYGDYFLRTIDTGNYEVHSTLIVPATDDSYSMKMLQSVNNDEARIEAFINVDATGDEDSPINAPFSKTYSDLDGTGDIVQDIVFMPPLILNAPTEGTTGVSTTPTFSWQDYSGNNPPTPWIYAFWVFDDASQANFPDVVWGLPSTMTSFDMANPPAASEIYDIAYVAQCIMGGGTVDINLTCSGATPTPTGSATTLPANGNFHWAVIVATGCDLTDYYNKVDTDPANGMDDFTDCLIPIISGSGGTYAESAETAFSTGN